MMKANDGIFPFGRDELLKDIRKGGPDSVYGTVVCKIFLPCVVGSVNWRRKCGVSLICDFVTVSDEVFCLFMLENSYDMWVDGWEFKQRVKSGVEENRRRKKTERVNPLYTTGSAGEAGKYKGWNKEGMERWNELYKKVKGCRADDCLFDMLFREEMKLEGVTADVNDSGSKSSKEEMVELLDDLEDYSEI